MIFGRRTALARWVVALATVPALAGCATQSYAPNPIDPARNADRLAARGLSQASLGSFLASKGYAPETLRREGWSLSALTVAALYNHPDLSAAKAQWRTRKAAEQAAAQAPLPAVSTQIQHQEQQTPFDSSPWSLGAGLEVTFVTADKTAIRVAHAEAISEQAALAIAAGAWAIRKNVRDGFVNCFAADRESALLDAKMDLHEQEVRLFDVRQSAGEASPSDVSLARQRLGASRIALATQQGSATSCRAELAAALGMPYDAIAHLPLAFDALERRWPDTLPATSARALALVNRLDVREALARYGASEARLRLEVARQYPDITISPGLLWDQGDLVWSLGSSILLPFYNRNAGAIAEAEAARGAEAAQLLSVQTQVLSELGMAEAHYGAALNLVRTAEQVLRGEGERLNRLERRLSAGDASRLAIIRARLDLMVAEQSAQQQRMGVLRAVGELEDASQHPLLGDPSIGLALREAGAPAADDRTIVK